MHREVMTTLFFSLKLERNDNFRYRVYTIAVSKIYTERCKKFQKKKKKKRLKRKFLIEILFCQHLGFKMDILGGKEGS